MEKTRKEVEKRLAEIDVLITEYSKEKVVLINELWNITKTADGKRRNK